MTYHEMVNEITAAFIARDETKLYRLKDSFRGYMMAEDEIETLENLCDALIEALAELPE